MSNTSDRIQELRLLEADVDVRSALRKLGSNFDDQGAWREVVAGAKRAGMRVVLEISKKGKPTARAIVKSADPHIELSPIDMKTGKESGSTLGLSAREIATMRDEAPHKSEPEKYSLVLEPVA